MAQRAQTDRVGGGRRTEGRGGKKDNMRVGNMVEEQEQRREMEEAVESELNGPNHPRLEVQLITTQLEVGSAR